MVTIQAISRLAVVVTAFAIGSAAAPHPLHTSLGELVFDEPSGAVKLEIRVFEADFVAATDSIAPKLEEPHRSVAYLNQTLALRGSDGLIVTLQWAGSHKTDDLLWIRLRGHAPAGLSGGSISQAILLERFPDQVNILKIRSARSERTLLFTRNSKSKEIP